MVIQSNFDQIPKYQVLHIFNSTLKGLCSQFNAVAPLSRRTQLKQLSQNAMNQTSKLHILLKEILKLNYAIKISKRSLLCFSYENYSADLFMIPRKLVSCTIKAIVSLTCCHGHTRIAV